ncbi:MAG: tetratricopeptide repeat protein, partial [Nannocystaceae bacterium]|nr:tetratricopeptide repeat protein [Nannocystaceae bacterium]
TAAALDRRWACLRDREGDLRTTTQIMASQPAGPATLTTQFRALEALAPPARCEDDRRLELNVAPPPVAIAVKVQELSAIGRRVRAGSYWFVEGAADELDAAIESATQLGYGPLTARLLMYRGQFERDRNELARARETLESAALLATASKADTLAALCWVTIISMEGYANQNFDGAIALLPLANARITRMENPADLVGMRERTLALVYDTAAKYEEAERHHLEALKWTEQAYGGVTVSYAEVLANIGAHYSRRRRPKLAQLRTEEALEITRRRLGPGSLNEALLLRNLAVNATVQSQPGRAAELANASLTIIGEFLSPDDSRMAPFLTAAGEANLVIGQSELAIDQLTRALELSEASLPATHPLLVDTRRIVGEAYTEVGRLQDADAVLGRAMVDLDTHRPHVRAQLLYDVGALRLAQGRYADATESCERARREAVDVPAEDLVEEATRCRDDARGLAAGSLSTD